MNFHIATEMERNIICVLYLRFYILHVLQLETYFYLSNEDFYLMSLENMMQYHKPSSV